MKPLNEPRILIELIESVEKTNDLDTVKKIAKGALRTLVELNNASNGVGPYAEAFHHATGQRAEAHGRN